MLLWMKAIVCCFHLLQGLSDVGEKCVDELNHIKSSPPLKSDVVGV